MGCGKSKPKLNHLHINTQGKRGTQGEGEYGFFKILTVGDPGVGKSSIIIRYTEDQFSEIGTFGTKIDFKTRLITVHDENVKLQIWDTAGHEKFRTMTSSYYRGSHGILIVYDISNRDSFKNVTKWISETENYAPENNQMIVVGNKSDLGERAVQYEEGEALALSFGLLFKEVSAKDNHNIDELFQDLATKISDAF
eukprot:TRINITY_DN15_c1_g1_i1.p1 TRINITY_DN15_c1_g1~~TRINITY_DN15_c1_g1_i1.p1  ORF type:complete len:196 (-),score=48.76 TRINITY_DN15_c1_g1_i1:42-629(-)